MTVSRRIAAAVLLAIPAVAWAAPWDWDEEFESRHWRTASLNWASDIHPDHPSHLDLVTYWDPPAHEMWCHYSEQPTQGDFNKHGDLMKDWLHYFLEIPANEPLPELPGMPPECIR